jgi:hypothetical protein
MLAPNPDAEYGARKTKQAALKKPASSVRRKTKEPFDEVHDTPPFGRKLLRNQRSKSSL